jgi:hypothetical protein
MPGIRMNAVADLDFAFSLRQATEPRRTDDRTGFPFDDQPDAVAKGFGMLAKVPGVQREELNKLGVRPVSWDSEAEQSLCLAPIADEGVGYRQRTRKQNEPLGLDLKRFRHNKVSFYSVGDEYQRLATEGVLLGHGDAGKGKPQCHGASPPSSVDAAKR